MTKTVCDFCDMTIAGGEVHLIAPAEAVNDPDGEVHHYDFCDLTCLESWLRAEGGDE